MNTFQQAILLTLLIVGHAIPISITVLLVRRKAFETKFKGISHEWAQNRIFRRIRSLDPSSHRRTDASSPDWGVDQIRRPDSKGSAKVSEPVDGDAIELSTNTADDDHIRWTDDDQITLSHVRTHRHRNHHHLFHNAGVGARLDLNNHPSNVTPHLPVVEEEEEDLPPLKSMIRGTQKYFASKGSVARNSQFYGLTVEEREKLGGVEYRAISFLSIVVFLYWALFLVLGIVGMGTWLEVNHPDIPRRNGLSPFWTGAFFAVSAFVNSGMSLLDDNMTALQTRYDLSLNSAQLIILIDVQCVPNYHHGDSHSCRKYTVSMFSEVHYMDYATFAPGRRFLEAVGGNVRFYLGSSQTSVHQPLPGTSHLVFAWYYHSLERP